MPIEWQPGFPRNARTSGFGWHNHERDDVRGQWQPIAPPLLDPTAGPEEDEDWPDDWANLLAEFGDTPESYARSSYWY